MCYLNYNLFELHNLLIKKKISSLELCKYFLKSIQSFSNNPFFLNINHEYVFKQAKMADYMISKKSFNILTGIPLFYKDIYSTKNFLSSCGSKFLKNYLGPYNSTLVKKLKNFGMIFIGKTNMDEFGIGSYNLNFYYGFLKNYLNNFLTPGGSSGGSVLAVSSGIVPISIGSDTGGSIRQPSCFNNLFGFKPTYGRISRYGFVPYSSSLDTVGIVSSNILDCAIIMNSISGFDLKDYTSISFKKVDFTKLLFKHNLNFNKCFLNLVIGVSKGYYNNITDFDIRSNIEFVLLKFEFLGAKIIELCFSFLIYISSIYYVISSCELSSNMARFDNIIYGINNNFDINYVEKSRSKFFFSNLLKNRIIIGNYILSNKSKYFLHSKKLRRLIINDFQNKFKFCDIILTPVFPVLSLYRFNINIFKMSILDIYTSISNLSGLPSINVPSGHINKYNLKIPLSFQIIGNYCEESKIFKIVYNFQQNNFNF